ncbi:hypothetical protein FGO68_gene8828 [Halteria grandinella]|uniref:RING-type domain-containing protein n=1 Tax=Halteria grandinella TaxID=5974 RepID=A0A8J8SVE4_HALGN|nr:hypothetical protein FGO68_gene8828 [Halteria grandinella]
MVQYVPQLSALSVNEKSQIKGYLKKMPKQNYCIVEGEKMQIADYCTICFNEFGPDEKVRETQCKHIFHSDCIIIWIMWKLPRPHCPNCRQEFSR